MNPIRPARRDLVVPFSNAVSTAALCLALAACGTSIGTLGADGGCDAGATQACLCSDGESGQASCAADGGFGACACATPDTGTSDAGGADSGSDDAGHADAGPADAGSQDAGSQDAGHPDAGPADAGCTNSCPASGTKQCVGANQSEVCLERNGCLTWTELSDCPACNAGECAPACGAAGNQWLACASGLACNVDLQPSNNNTSYYSGCTAARFSADAGMVADLVTGLVWQQGIGPAGAGYTYVNGNGNTSPTSIQFYCNNLSLGGAVWRVPADDELFSLLFVGSRGPDIDQAFFPNTPIDEPFWGSDKTFSGATVSFANGYVGTFNGDSGWSNQTYYAKCVQAQAMESSQPASGGR